MTNFVTQCKYRNAYGCVECQKDFYLGLDRQCYGYEAGCLSYYKGKCLKCSNYQGYELDQNGRCINKNQVNVQTNCV